MAPTLTSRTRPTKPKKQLSSQKRKRDHGDLEALQQKVADLDPKTSTSKDFNDLPLSDFTRAGLKAAHYSVMTDIQAKSIPYILKGKDLLGAAKTGQGKTLAFLVPLLENLYRAQCVGVDAGLAGIILSPTRELATQIFDVLRKIGSKGHIFAAGLVIGGKSLADEQAALARMNIVVATPGRFLQHLSQTVGFDVDNLRMLVLDEADRILDMGFQRDLDAIVEYLPKERQTLLFSATQSRRVQDLARLSLKEPEYVSVDEGAAAATPKSLQQNYVITPLHEKIDTLWSFIQASKKQKILVFLSSAKQVRFVYDSFRHMQPGIPLLHLHGSQKQTVRLEITQKFSASKNSCLFATDVAARGLDFPAVDWVVQVDCPEDVDTYIHRVGRTARYERDGKAVLFLAPSEEEAMLERLMQKRVPIERINIRQKKLQSLKNQLQNMCFKDPQLKYLGQKAFVSYVRSLYLQHDKAIFKLAAYDLEEFAASLGLPGAPHIKFLKGENAKDRKNAPRFAAESSDDEAEAADGVAKKTPKSKDGVRTKHDRMFERTNQDVFTDHYTKLIRDDDAAPADGTNAEDDDEFLAVKRRIPVEAALSDLSSGEDDENAPKHKSIALAGASAPLILDSKRREKLLKSKKKLLQFKDRGSKILFDDAGNAHEVYELEDEETFKARGEASEQRKKFLEKEKERVDAEDVGDKEVERARKKARREKRKRRAAEGSGDDDGEEGGGVELEADGDAFQAFLDLTKGLVNAGDEEAEKPAKRPRKWFEDASDDEGGERRGKKTKGKTRQAREQPETLEDLEALASGLLG